MGTSQVETSQVDGYPITYSLASPFTSHPTSLPAPHPTSPHPPTSPSTVPPNAQGNFIDDEWFDDDRKGENGGVAGPSLEGPGSESAAHDTGMDGDAIRRMQNDWRKTMDAANAAVIAADGYTWRLFYNNGTCAQAPFAKAECKEYMDIACSKAAPLEENALFYGFSGMTGCSPDDAAASPSLLSSHASRSSQSSQSSRPPSSPAAPLLQWRPEDPIIDKLQHLASFLLIRGPYAWLGWAWLGCGNFPYVCGGVTRWGVENGVGWVYM